MVKVNFWTIFLAALLLCPLPAGALDVETASDILNTSQVEGGLIVQIGCGDGRVLRRARKRYGVKAIGYELNLLAYLQAKLLCFGLKDVKVKWRNFWSVDLSGADVVFCYLFPDVMKDLAAKLESDLKPGAVVVSCNFDLPGFSPDQVLRPGNSLHNDPIYIYRLHGE